MAASTHTVTNQVPPLVGYDVFAGDRALTEAVERHLAPGILDEAREELSRLGRSAGSFQAQEWGAQANENPPRLRTHDRYGHRIDEVDFHPAWHRLLGHAVTAGLTDAWGRQGGHVRRAAGFLVWTQAEAGHGCPLSMTHAAVPALRTDPALAAEWEPLLTSHVYEEGLRPASQKTGVLFGMGMTEKQGGTDVRSNTTRAEALAADGEYLLTGHKWFCSAPMSDGFLVLAQAAGGLSCFLVPRVLPDGARNPFAIQRLKDKLGNRSNASGEVEFDGTWARRVGEEGRGVRTIIEMVAATRLDCVVGSAALMRQAVAQAIHHSAHRSAFGGLLIEKPLMRNVLADLALESEAATTLALRLAAAYDADTEQDRAFLRIAVPAAKYWVTKRCSAVVGEALECLGGNGYVEESGMPRLLREAPLNSIWEGSGNVQALDVLRALQREPGALDAFLREVGKARGADHRLDAAIKDLLTELADLEAVEARARRLVERMALVLQGSLLLRWAPPEVADAFCASRLGGDWGSAFGTLPHSLDLATVVERARAGES
ncbi:MULTISPECIES: acyl-CoA dehydrogenase family protein [Streptomyces]|uniref:Acyl-CoA dehydrogenase family protein n=1 Tax=Streptomyces glycanivorans TaxID=3033808 RepID=A0ABY9J8R4_9ACTN|nr:MULTISPECIES: acyl-CoA dehydrogenase family protein [unclassified Streptomyces]WSQ76743.1 acyl-CoA dehydrogenase family protein [Streptomyces sp. NBC_01213]TXS18639.1 DNA alkylation response protein [Streptomyces sp. wa22]WLQ63234.1 acyl-CoA dehydrogenase family protein [Streptomyces sp. Alt3]WSQ84076.1 acyl-CoA dehydrogenase family protein [Streptomyces sp. NBC_01212]WSR09978.1 acyl-CoA dehydrogenase family protein [Streptomyces sp. NBC_01208]